MVEIKNEEEEEEEVVEESLDLPKVVEGEEDTTDWKAEAQKLRDKAIAQRERTKTLKLKLADKEKAIEALATGSKKAEPSKTGELDETQLDYLDLKGVSEAEDVKIIEDIVKKTGMTVRQALKDDYVQAKLTANKGQREVKDATPSGTKRSGNSGGTDIATAIAKYEQANYDPASLPDNFALRSAVINAITAKTDPNRPAWQR